MHARWKVRRVLNRGIVGAGVCALSRVQVRPLGVPCEEHPFGVPIPAPGCSPVGLIPVGISGIEIGDKIVNPGIGIDKDQGVCIVSGVAHIPPCYR